jgi:hypothetical protein
MLIVCIVLSMRLNLELDCACAFAASKSLFMPLLTHIVWKCSLANTASLVLFGHLTSICAQASSVCTQTPMGKPHGKCAHLRMHANIHIQKET